MINVRNLIPLSRFFTYDSYIKYLVRDKKKNKILELNLIRKSFKLSLRAF